MQGVATLTAPILQLRQIDREESVGYGATRTVPSGTKLAVVELGYADGWLRKLTNRTFGFLGDFTLPLVGRVSMDMVMLDVTSVPESLLREGVHIEFMGARQGVDQVAEQTETIGYEIFTRLGSRVRRVYVGG